MNLLQKIWLKLGSLVRHRAVKQEIDEELRFHIEQCTAENIAAGMSPEEAAREARKRFGNLQSIREECRETRGASFCEAAIRDLRFGFRRLVKSPGFTAVAVLTLALGIGANTAIFSLLDAVVFRSLPVKNPQQLTLLSPDESAPSAKVGLHSVSYPLYRALRDDQTVFDGLLCHFRLFANVRGRGETQRITVELVSGNYFEVLGVGAALGRTLTPNDDRHPGAHPVAVLSYDYWMSDFAGDPAVLGQTLQFNGQLLTIVGVSEKGFTGVDLDFQPQIRVPMMMTATLFPSMTWVGLENSGMRWVEVFGRLKPGVSLVQAQAALQPLYHSWMQSALDAGAFGQPSESDRKKFLQSSLTVRTGAHGTSFLRRDWSTPLRALGVMSGLLLLLTCVNVATLFIDRGIARRGELAVRLALGATRARIVCQLLVESLILAALGGAAGIWLAPLATKFLIPLLPVTTDGPPNISAGLNGSILFVSLAATAVAAVLSGLLPALLSTRVDLAPALKQATFRTLPRGRFRQALVVVQVTLSVLLLFGSGLFVRSLRHLYSVAPGFEIGSVVAFGVDPVLNGYPRARAEKFYRQVQERLAAMPGIDSAAIGLVRLFAGTDVWQTGTAVDGLPPPADGNQVVSLNAVSPDYFRTLHIGLRQGRDFRAAEQAGSPPVVIVNKSFVRQFLGDRKPLGQNIWLPSETGNRRVEIIGVVADSHYESVLGACPPQVFVPYSQLFTVAGMNGYVRSTLPAGQVASLIRAAVREVDSTVPIHALRTMSEQRDRSLGRERVVALLATAFGVLATLLAGVGLFGVLNYSVARRTRELGLRLALGAPGTSVAWLVMKEVLVLSGLGLLLAIPVAWAAGRLVASQLHGVMPADPWTAAATALLLTLVAIFACWLPARRAVRIDPMSALRYE
jgi:putative ABC transport system permease protein